MPCKVQCFGRIKKVQEKSYFDLEQIFGFRIPDIKNGKIPRFKNQEPAFPQDLGEPSAGENNPNLFWHYRF